jgi:cytosine/adenosine deaminase-related metal-dependent hydrolase
VSGGTLYTADWVLPIATPPIAQGAVLVRGSSIVWVGEASAFDTWHRASPEAATDGRHGSPEVVSLGAAILMPGLVNAHTHLELTALRGLLEGFAFKDWLRTLTVVRRDLLSADDLLDAARVGIVEGLEHGITTYADTTDSAAPLEAMRELAVRGIGYVEVFGPDPAHAADAMVRLEARVSALRARDSDLVHCGVSPHAPYTVSAALFRAVAAFATTNQLPVAVHIAESEAETLFVRDGNGPFADGLRARGIAVGPQAESPIALLEATGLLKTRPLLIHAVRATDADLARVANAGARIVHCPISNAKLGHGIAPLDRMLAHGVATGLGTDSVVSNDRLHLLDEARQATLLHAVRSGVPDSLSAQDALELATRGGARALGLDDQIGTIEAGKEADLAAFPLVATGSTPLFDPAVTLVHVLAGAARASLVTVAGRVRLRDGIVTETDPAWFDRFRAIRERLRQWRLTLTS